MNETNKSYFLFGGSFFAKLLPALQNIGTVFGQWSGVSPISKISQSVKENTSGLTCWLDELDEHLSADPADYFVLDLQLALTKLIATDAGLVSASTDNLSHITRGEVTVVDPVILPKQTVSAALDRLIAVIAGHFSARNIILIHTHNSPFWLAGNSLRAEISPGADAVHAAWLEALEKEFCQKSGCHFVDVTKFYFYRKEAGRPLTNVVFEDECYLDVAQRIREIANGGSGKAERPNFEYSLDRYARYYFTLQKKPQQVFLNSNYFLDKLILCSSDNFVKQYRESLLELDLLDWHDPGKALALLRKFDPDSLLTKICAAFFAVCNKEYGLHDTDYALMFRSEVVPEEVIADLKKEYAPGAKLLPAQINRDNAGYHFARRMNLDPTPFTTGKTVIAPSVIDVFGSCVSRTPFNVQDNDFAVNNYWFHVPPFESRNKPVENADSLFSAKMNWKERLVKQQFDCQVYQKIRESTSEWLVLDLYSLVSPNNFFYKNCLYGDFDHAVSARLKAKRVTLTKEPNPIGSQDAVIAALDPWLEVIRKKYGNRIIMIDVQRFQHWIGDDEQIYTLPSASPSNAFLARAAQHVRSRTDCYQISVGRYFLPEESGYLRNTPTHMEDVGYLAVHDIARYIVDHEPKQKVFDQYSGQVHMARLERLRERNQPGALHKALPLTELDKAVVQLDHDTMRCWHDELAALYDSVAWTKTLEEVLAVCPSEKLGNILRQAAKQALPDVKIENNYRPYPDDGVIVGGFSGNCDLPTLPGVSMKQLVNSLDAVTISWTCPADTTVCVYRKEEGLPWIMVGFSKNGQFKDQTAAPLKEYQYCLCTEVQWQSRRYRGNFTLPKTIKTVPAAPALISAVHLSGANTLRWMPVRNTLNYLVYRKTSQDQKWKLCATVSAASETCYTEESVAGGEWYTVRAVAAVDNKEVAGGFHSGICAMPL